MPRKLRELRADSRRAGFVSDTRRGKGSHTYWEHPLLPGERVTLAGADGDDARPYQERDVRAALAKRREGSRRQP
jgi:predicted RNA binding protein YcfA (HicA-like mRNA interferase family)